MGIRFGFISAIKHSFALQRIASQLSVLCRLLMEIGVEVHTTGYLTSLFGLCSYNRTECRLLICFFVCRAAQPMHMTKLRFNKHTGTILKNALEDTPYSHFNGWICTNRWETNLTKNESTPNLAKRLKSCGRHLNHTPKPTHSSSKIEYQFSL